MAISRRGKLILKLKRDGLLSEKESYSLNMSEVARKRQRYKLRLERIQMMRDLKKDDLGW
jgi:hypothetical protein